MRFMMMFSCGWLIKDCAGLVQGAGQVAVARNLRKIRDLPRRRTPRVGISAALCDAQSGNSVTPAFFRGHPEPGGFNHSLPHDL